MYLLCVHVCGHACVKSRMWRSEDNLWELILSFHQMGSGDQTQVVRFAPSATTHQIIMTAP